MKSTGVVRRIDDLGRIVIPKEIRKTLRIRDGESLEIFADKESITLKKFSQSTDLADISQALLDVVYNTIKKSLFVTDRDCFIAGSGDLKKEFLGCMISKELEDNLTQLEKLKKSNVPMNHLTNREGLTTTYNYILRPILLDSEAVGFVLMIASSKEANFSEEDERIIQIISQFLTKYLEE